MELTTPLTFGFQVVIAYGAVALKLNALLRAYTVVLYLIEVKLPTAYMMPPHCTSCRTCSVVPVGFNCGVAPGLVDTAADADAANPVRHTAAAAATTPARRYICP